MTKKRIRKIISRIIFISIFVVTAITLVAATNGYLFNQSTGRFEQTGLINLTVKQEPVAVSVNGKKKLYKKTPINLGYLVPGVYTIEVTKDDYIPWSKTFTVRPGEVIVNPSVTLFRNDIPAETATINQELTLTESVERKIVDPDLDIRGREMWAKPITRTYPFPVVADNFNLIGRFINPIDYAIFHPTRYQIFFQIGNEIRVVDREGTNDHVLVRLTNVAPTVFTLVDDGKTLIYRDGDAVLQKRVQ